MSSLADLTRPELVFPDLPGADASTVLKALSDRVAPWVTGIGAEELYRRLQEREELGSTGIGSGVAIPHCKMERLESAVLAVGLVRKGVDFHAVDQKPVRIFFLLVSPEKAPAAHLQVLAAISKWVKNGQTVDDILAGGTRERIYQLLDRKG